MVRVGEAGLTIRGSILLDGLLELEGHVAKNR